MTKYKVTERKITDYLPDAANANEGSVRGLAMLEDSLAQDGVGRSIVADANDRIPAGNKTLEAAVNTGLEDVIEVETDGHALIVHKRRDWNLDDPEGAARRYAYRDNRTSEVSLVWNAEQLLADLNAGADLSQFWDKGELDELLAGLREPPPDPGPQVDRAAELQQKWQVERGDLWVIGNHRLLCGDSTVREDVERVMAGEVASLVVTDPPYGVEYADKNTFLNAIARGNRIQTPIAGDHHSKEATQALWKAAFKEMAEVMDAGATVYCFMPQGGDQMMMMMMMMGAGIEPRHEIIWLKNNHVLGRTDYAYKHEPILYAWKEGGHRFYGEFQTSVIECDKPLKSDLHPTTKPVELVERLTRNSSQSNEVVYDPFGGSGTTMVACEQLSRQCRMIEIEPKYCAVILERMQGMGLEPSQN